MTVVLLKSIAGYSQIGNSLAPESRSDVEEIPGDEFSDEEDAKSLGVGAAGEANELALSDAELRARHVTGAGVFLGEVVPWATAGIEALYLASPYRVFSLVAGAGSFDQFGKRTDIRSVDITSNTRAFGLVGRWFFKGMPQLSMQAASTYVLWKGKASPHGADADTDSAALEALSSGFDATSVSFGVGLNLTKVWTNGIYFEWLPVGIKKSVILKKSFGRSDTGVENTVEKFIERQEIFGFINARVGIYF